MKNFDMNTARKWLDILLSISFAIAGICLIGGCLSIYYSGDQPYSREAVAEAFSKICIPVYICLGLTAISIIWQFIYPSPEKKIKPRKAYSLIYNRLVSKKDIFATDAETANAIMTEQQKRTTMSYIRATVIAVCSVAFLIYALNSNNFHQSDINRSMIRAMLVLAPCLAVSFSFSLFTFYYNEKSLIRETELLKKAVDSSSVEKEITYPGEKVILYVRIALICIAVAAVIYGFIAGGTADVLTKAINICTECIGLG